LNVTTQELGIVGAISHSMTIVCEFVRSSNY
jgi:hypothetical protein